MKGISQRELKLVLIDDPDQPAWQVEELMENLIPYLNGLCILTKRGEAFSELAEEAFAEYGLVLTAVDQAGSIPYGNLTADLRDWEKHLSSVFENVLKK